MSSSKTALITGATSGIGSEIARHLAKSGYNIIVLGRSREKLDVLMSSLEAINSSIETEGILCDFSSFDSTTKACKNVHSNYQTIDLLILNAGLWNSEFRESIDEIEETLHVNLLSQMQVFDQLHQLVPKNEKSKVIFTSSGLHQGEFHFDDPEFRENFSGFKAYRQSKLALLMLTRWLAKQQSNNGISFYSVHPGMVSTNLGRDASWFARIIFKLFGKSLKKGARTHNYLIDTNNDTLTNGEYYADCKVSKSSSYSYDMNIARKLWDTVNNYLTANLEV